jgi:hypothetical protein
LGARARLIPSVDSIGSVAGRQHAIAAFLQSQPFDPRSRSPMNRPALVAVALALAASALFAQTPTAPKKKPAQKAAKAPPPPPEPVLPAADADQLKAAGLIHYGNYPCELNQTIDVSADAKHEGYVDVKFGKLTWVMKPVLSSTGALRMEDVRGQALLLQIAYKSELLDVKNGHRLVDECVHEKQAALRRKNEAEEQAEAASAAAAAAAASAASAKMAPK